MARMVGAEDRDQLQTADEAVLRRVVAEVEHLVRHHEQARREEEEPARRR
jgi:hypothetical protein